MLHFEDSFFPVGQGLFYSGRIYFTGKSEREWKTMFVFDCGSVSRKVILNKSISKFHNRLDKKFVDFVVLSHLHEDHTNGLENLLAADMNVGAVFLPYLNPSQRLIVALRSITQDDAYYLFLADPTAYLLNRRVRRVVYLRGGGGEDQEGGVADNFPDEPPEDNGLDKGIVMKCEMLVRHKVDRVRSTRRWPIAECVKNWSELA